MANRLFTASALIMLAVALSNNLISADEADVEPVNWTKLISAKTIEAEVTWLQSQLDENMATPNKFYGGGGRRARVHFTELAMLFAILEQCDPPMKWAEFAPQLRMQFARAAAACQVSTPESFLQANESRAMLQSLLAGDELVVIKKVDAFSWPNIVELSSVMERMEQWRIEIGEHLATEPSFAANRADILRSAELIAAVAAVLRQPTMEYDGDSEFLDHTKNLSRHADVLRKVVQRQDRLAALVAQRMMVKNCNQCHQSYR